MKEKHSELRTVLHRVVDNWDSIYIRVSRDYHWENLPLTKCTEKEIVNWFTEFLLNATLN